MLERVAVERLHVEVDSLLHRDGVFVQRAILFRGLNGQLSLANAIDRVGESEKQLRLDALARCDTRRDIWCFERDRLGLALFCGEGAVRLRILRGLAEQR